MICLESFKPEDDIIKLNCNEGHVFHLACIEGWAMNNNTCPLCRQYLFNDSDIRNINLQ